MLMLLISPSNAKNRCEDGLEDISRLLNSFED
jgi:hypothetical protein